MPSIKKEYYSGTYRRPSSNVNAAYQGWHCPQKKIAQKSVLLMKS